MLLSYFAWHYGKALRSVFGIAGNFLVFSAHLFSTRELLGSLFSPWKQVAYVWRGGAFAGEAFTVFLTNFMSRFFGAIARSALIGVGLLFIPWMVLWCIALVFVWVVAPLLPPLFFVSGIMLL